MDTSPTATPLATRRRTAVTALTAAQILAIIYYAALLAIVAGATPYASRGTAAWDGFMPPSLGWSWALHLVATTAILWAATSVKRHLRTAKRPAP